jgi:hypothetical protein
MSYGSTTSEVISSDSTESFELPLNNNADIKIYLVLVLTKLSLTVNHKVSVFLERTLHVTLQ